MNITLDRNKLPRLLWVGCARCGWQGRAGRLAALLVLLGLPLLLAAAPREPGAERLQQALRRFPDADLNKDGKLTLDEWREFRRRMQTGGAAEASRAANAAAQAPTAAATDTPPIGPVQIRITSEKPVPVNPRVYGIICEEMFVKDLVDEPEYIAALVDLKFKTYNYPGGSISYYHHPRGTGGFNIRPAEVAKSRHGDESRFMKEGSGPDHFEQYLQFVKASGGEAVFTANILNGTVAELDEFLTRLQAERIPIAAVVLGVEMHLGQAEALGLDGYIQRIKPYITMLQARYPRVPIVAHSTPVGRVGQRARDSFHEWNRQLAKLPGISGFSQYGWPEFGGQPRLQTLRSGLTAETPSEIWQQYDEFVRTFPTRQIPVYQQDWGSDKKMYMLQWGTHADRNTPVQGLHIANFYFFLAQYNAAHDDYFAAATSALVLADKASGAGRRGGGILYKEKIALLAPYLYTKPFRHLFSGDKKLLTASVNGAKGGGQGQTVKALAAAGPDGRKYVYVINSGPAVALGGLTVDGEALPPDLPLQVESVFGSSASISAGSTSAPATTFAGEKKLRDLTLQPWSLTLLIAPTAGKKAARRSEADPQGRDPSNPAFAAIQDDPALPRVLLIGDSISVGYTLAVREALAGKANVHRPAANCGNTTKGLKALRQWLGDGHWDVIHFNWGLHDLTSINDQPETPLNEYEKNLSELVARLKKTGATLVWCSTTPVPPGRRAPLKPEDVLRYNEVAQKIMDENGIAIDDLYAFALPRLKEIQLPTNVHVTPEGSKVLAQQVAASIEAVLKQPTAGNKAAPRSKAELHGRDPSNPAFAAIQDDPALPRVLLIGDSISIGYTVPVQKALAGKANVHRPAANCGTTTKGLENLNEWLGDGHWDVIHFNWGLHDLQQMSLEQYEKNLRELVTRLKKSGAVLVWCSTTPVPVMGPGRKNNEDVKAYNATAKRIMDENGIQIDDLFAFSLPQINDIQIPKNVHFTAHGYRSLAEQVTASILAALKRRPAGSSSAQGAGQSAAIAKPSVAIPSVDHAQGRV